MPFEEKKTSPVVTSLFILIALLVAAGVFEYLYLRASGDVKGFEEVKEAIFKQRTKEASEFSSKCPVNERLVFSASKSDLREYSDIYMLCLSNGALLNVTNDQNGNFAPQLSPDGMTVYYYAPRDTSTDINDWEIWRSNLSGTEKKRLSDNPLADTSPALSPDGTKLAFASDDGGLWQLHIMDADGNNEIIVPTAGVLGAAFSDSKTILFTQYDEEKLQDIFMYNIGSGDIERITETPTQESSLSVSSDGEYILFDSRETGTFQIYRLAVESGEVVQLTNTTGNNGLSEFSPNGKKVVFVSDRDGVSKLYSMTINGTNQQELMPGLNLQNVRDPAFAAQPN